MRSYGEKLKDPRWQRKRLEILQRDQFMCRICQDSESELHVHHRCYVNGKSPWEYADDEYVTLCKNCHDRITYLVALIRSESHFEPFLDMMEKIFQIYCEPELWYPFLKLVSTIHRKMIDADAHVNHPDPQ